MNRGRDDDDVTPPNPITSTAAPAMTISTGCAERSSSAARAITGYSAQGDDGSSATGMTSSAAAGNDTPTSPLDRWRDRVNLGEARPRGLRRGARHPIRLTSPAPKSARTCARCDTLANQTAASRCGSSSRIPRRLIGPVSRYATKVSPSSAARARPSSARLVTACRAATVDVVARHQRRRYDQRCGPRHRYYYNGGEGNDTITGGTLTTSLSAIGQ